MVSQNGSMTPGTFLGLPLKTNTYLWEDIGFLQGTIDSTSLCSHIYIRPLNPHRAVYTDYLEHVELLKYVIVYYYCIIVYTELLNLNYCIIKTFESMDAAYLFAFHLPQHMHTFMNLNFIHTNHKSSPFPPHHEDNDSPRPTTKESWNRLSIWTQCARKAWVTPNARLTWSWSYS